MQDLQNKALTVLGLSRSGAAVARYGAKRGARVFLSETTPASPQNEALRTELIHLGVEVEMGGHSKACFTHADEVVVSPGIPPSSTAIEQLKLSGKTVISEVEFAYRQAPDIPMVGITGTNGKSTTTTLVSWILSQAGFKAPACGNIGVPITDVIDAAKPDYLVAELSSFQLAFSPSLKAKVAIFTNFKPDHLDWHGSLEAYQAAKLKLFTLNQSPEWAVVLADDPVGQRIASLTQGKVLWFSRDQHLVAGYANKAYLDANQRMMIHLEGHEPQALWQVDALQLIGDHNYENMLAAASASYLLGLPTAQIISGCEQFAGLEHRLEKVPVVTPKGVPFYNDSKATNTDAAVSALRAFKQDQVILIAGGYDKLTPLDDFITAVQANAKQVILIGAAKARFAQALEAAGYTSLTFVESLEEATHQAYQISTGEAILFSPACSSFDMFKNFEERGAAFKRAVHLLAQDTKTELTH